MTETTLKTTLKTILEEICAEEITEYERLKPHHFSRSRHRRAMGEILHPSSCSYSDRISLRHRHIPTKKRLLLIAVAIITAMQGTAISGAMLRGFRHKDYPDHTMLLAANAQNCPKTIETVYYLPEIPEGYELYEENYRIPYVTIFYENNTTKRSMAFCQDVKEGYAVNFDNEHHTFEEVDINGRYGLYQKPNDENDISGTIVWDNGDYILQISGNFTKDQLLDLAKSVTH